MANPSPRPCTRSRDTKRRRARTMPAAQPGASLHRAGRCSGDGQSDHLLSALADDHGGNFNCRRVRRLHARQRRLLLCWAVALDLELWLQQAAMHSDARAQRTRELYPKDGIESQVRVPGSRHRAEQQLALQRSGKLFPAG